jgi:hypothetical protein
MQRIVNDFTGSSHFRIYCEARRFYSNGYEDFHFLEALYGVVSQKMEIFLTKSFISESMVYLTMSCMIMPQMEYTQL